MSGATWGETENLSFTEEKHETGYCLELWSERTAKVPINVQNPEFIKSVALIERLTVPQVEELASALGEWAQTMREGGHYVETK